jgi:site-specific DNA-methyltransferase (adenine-specific)
METKNMIYRDHFQNYKSYNIPKAQLIIADIPYNLGNNAYASNPAWYKDGDNQNGESKLAGKSFFDTDEDFRPAEFMHFCSTMLKAESKPKKIEGETRTKGDAPCMIVFCAFDQQMYLIELAKKYGLKNYINLVFRKNFSAQVLKANMKVVGNCEYALIFYRDRLPKFRNNGKMIFNCMDWPRDNESEKIHPTQKPVELLKKLIEIFTDIGDVVIDPCCGSGSTIIAAERLNRKSYGFEIKKEFYSKANEWLLSEKQIKKDIEEFGFAKTLMEKTQPTLWTI